MIYTKTEKDRMDRVLEAFQDYVAASRSMDIAYSDKTGYVRLIIAEYADSCFFPIRTADDLLKTCFYDILCDQVELALARNPELTNATMDYGTVRDRIADYLDGMGPDRDGAMKKLDEYLRAQQKQERLP